jgi:recombination DNA repair RAD52 pathway protein
MVDSLKVGTSFVDKGFQSTDVLKSSATFYAETRKEGGAKGTNVLFRMTLSKGLNAVDVGYGEIAVQRNATMTVTNKSKSGDFTIIDVEVTK